jgi:hypothetical protein
MKKQDRHGEEPALRALPRSPFWQRIRADLIFRERLPGEEAFEPVQWQMPFRRFVREARRQGTDVNAMIRDFVCAALTERAEAITRANAQRATDAPADEGPT